MRTRWSKDLTANFAAIGDDRSVDLASSEEMKSSDGARRAQ